MRANNCQPRDKRQTLESIGILYTVKTLDEINVLYKHFLDAHRRHIQSNLRCQRHGHVFTAEHGITIFGAAELGNPWFSLLARRGLGARSTQRRAARQKTAMLGREIVG